MPQKQWVNDPDVVAQVKRMHGEGLSRAAIARAIGCAPATVGAIADKLGLSFDRAGTAAATQAKQIDNKVRRAGLVDRLYGAAEKQLERLEAADYTHRVNAGNQSFVVTDVVPNSDEVRNHTQAIYSALAIAAKLEALDTDPGAANARSTLLAIGQALGIAKPE